MKPRDRASAAGLLPRMEARPRKDGKVTYRYHTIENKAINLGTDKIEAIRKVLDLLGRAPDANTVTNLWRRYQETPAWVQLSQGTRADYIQASRPLLKTFGGSAPATIRPKDVAKYLRIERAGAGQPRGLAAVQLAQPGR